MQSTEMNPGKKFAVIGFILSFFSLFSVAGLIVSILALLQSKKAGYKNNLAVAAVILSSVNIVFVTPFVVVFALVAFTGLANTSQAHTMCTQQANVGMVTVGGDMYNCDPFGRMLMTAN